MAIKTYTEQLEQVQKAIEAIETGAQAVSFGDRSWSKADLQTLYAREAYLMPKAKSEESGRTRKPRLRGVRLW